MTLFAKLIDGKLSYAPSSKGNTLGYNLETNQTQLFNDGYKPVIYLENKEKYTDCEGVYSFQFSETEDAIKEIASFQPFNYAQLRKKAYPDMSELCDALVKLHSNDEDLKAEGQNQLDTYVQNCLNIKTKYPKP